MRRLNYVINRALSGKEELRLDLTVLFILEGSMTVRYLGDLIVMQKEDILLISPGISFKIINTREVLYAEALYSPALMSDIAGDRKLNLYADSTRDSMHSYQDLRSIFYELTDEYSANDHQTSAAIDSSLLKLLDCLAEHYQMSEDPLYARNENDARMREIIQYVIHNISGEINLSSLADEMFVSTSTLSRLFQKNTGMYFSDYVNKLRVRESLGLLRHSDQNLTRIAMICGFPSSSAFNRSFKKVTGMTPSQYRQQTQAQADERRREREEERQIREHLKEKNYLRDIQEIYIDAADKQKKTYKKVWGQVINIGSLYDLTHSAMQQHVLYLQAHLHFPYVRTWNIFSTKLNFSDGSTLNQYNFDMIDQALDFLVHHHMKPFLDLGRRPDTAVRNDRSAVYRNEEYIFFHSRKNWENAVSAFLSHIIRRYGEDETSGWIFELSRDPDHTLEEQKMYADPHYHYFDPWSYMYRQIRLQIPAAMVGGMSSLVDHDRTFLNNFFARCREDNCVPDFISFSLFPYEFNSPEDGADSGDTAIQNKYYEADQIRYIRRVMNENGLADRKLFITEWNTFISNRNYLNDSCFRSAYLVQKVSELWSETDLLAIMAGSDWVSSYMDTTGLLNGSIGLLSKDTIRKPAFFAIQFLNRLGKYYIGKGEHYIATMQDNGDLYILCFYFSWFRRNYLMQSEDLDLKKNIQTDFSDEKPLDCRIQIDNCKREGAYFIKRRVLNRTSGDILNAWGNFQYESDLSPQDIRYLQEITTPQIFLEKAAVGADRRMELNISLEPQEISLFHIYPV